MKSTKILGRIDRLGRFIIPKITRRELEIKGKTPLEIFVCGENIVLQKYKSYGMCPITGESSAKNIKLADGKLSVSQEGAKQLLTKLEQYLETK